MNSKHTHQLFFSLVFWALCVCIVQAQPVASFTPSIISGCSPLSVQFTNQSTNAVTYQWNFGNGNTSTLTNPSANYNLPGTYQVTLRASNGSQIDSTTRIITVFQNPTANFSIPFANGCVSDTICFINTSQNGSGTINQWLWDFGDGQTSTLQNPCHVYTNPGQYNITLVVTDNNGCQHSKTVMQAITVTASFQVNFTTSNATACHPPLLVNFTPTTSLPGSYTYQWNMGNGIVTTNRFPSVNYNNYGDYDVSLIVTSSNGCKQSITKTKIVRITKIVADFSPSDTVGCVPKRVDFVNQTLPDTPTIQYIWQVSNGLSSNQKSPAFTFNNPGVFNVSLIARMNNGCADTAIKNNIIRILPKLNANFQASKTTFCKTPAIVDFTALSNDTNITSYEWFFGDGSTGIGKQVQHTYLTYGKFNVKLVVRNSLGCVDSVVIQNYIHIDDAKPMLIINTKGGCASRFVGINVIDTNFVPRTNWTWFYRDTLIASGSSSSQIIFIDTAGIFPIKLIGTNSDGCTVELIDSVVAGVQIIPSFKADTNHVCFNPGVIEFENTSVADSNIINQISWSWEYGDGETSENFESPHKYLRPDSFNVILRANHRGCVSDSIFSDSVFVIQPRSDFSYEGLKCLNDTVTFTSEAIGANKWSWSIGNTIFYTDSVTKHVFTTHGNYEIKLIATDTLSGCRDTSSKTILLYRKPDMDIMGLTRYLCPPYFINLSDSSNYFGNPIIKKQWFIDDALMPNTDITSPVQNNLSVTLSAGRFIKLRLIATDSLQCEHTYDIDSALYTVTLKPYFNLTPNNGCVPLTVSATDSTISDFPVIKRFWEWGENGARDTMNRTTVNYTYNSAPLNQNDGYVVVLTAFDSLGCSNAVANVVLPSKPSGKFKYNIIKFCQYDSVRLEWDRDNILGFAPFTFKWYVDDTLVSTQQNFSRTFFETQRIVRIKLVVTDNNQCSDSSSALIAIDNRQPIANFYSVPANIKCPGPPIQLFDSSTAGATPIIKWTWNLGDGSSSNIKNPSKVYLIPDEYNISLTVEDSLGCKSTELKVRFIVIEGPWAETTVTPKVGCLPLEVSFKANNKRVEKIEWDIGDGALYSDSMFNHTFTKDGTFIPLLIVTDRNGCRLAVPSTDTIIVRPVPNTSFIANRNRLCTKDILQIINETQHTQTILNYNWSVGDSVFSRSDNIFDIQFSQGGNYSIKLEAIDVFGCKKSYQLTDSV